MMRRLLPLLGFLGLSSAAPETVTISVRSVKPVFLNDQGDSNAVRLRFYLLKEDARFRKASIDDLWVEHSKMLGTDLLKLRDETVLPGEAKDPPKKLDLGDAPEGLKFVGVLALMNKEDQLGSRKILLTMNDLEKVLRVTGYHIELEK
jgi:type VI secretion system VasD/TssJ family lipoprotein